MIPVLDALCHKRTRSVTKRHDDAERRTIVRVTFLTLQHGNAVLDALRPIFDCVANTLALNHPMLLGSADLRIGKHHGHLSQPPRAAAYCYFPGRYACRANL
ncbi:hypothetical protein F4W67_15220 [Pseudomonas caricapapayae]|nr:hypothetical protein F4W67_15220 [Pseudomonas caricapapayae]